MPILLRCPDCNAKIRAPEQIVGRQVRCPKCDAEFLAEDAPTAPPEPAADPYPVSQPAAPPERKDTAPPPPPPPRVEELRPDEADDDEQTAWKDEPRTPEPVYTMPVPGHANPVVDFLLFRTMIAPLIIQIVFWAGVVSCVVGGIVVLVLAVSDIVGGRNVGTGVGEAFGGLGVIFVGPLLVRIYCELFILFFRIYDTLRELLVATEKLRRRE